MNIHKYTYLIALLIGFSTQQLFAYSGGNGSSGSPYQINDFNDLHTLSITPADWLNNYFVLTADIDASPTKVLTYNGGEGFSPIGLDQVQYFASNFNGNNFSINNLYINRPDSSYQGLFGYAHTAIAQLLNINLNNADITGKNNVGILIGRCHSVVHVSNCSTNGNVEGQIDVGGLIGANSGSSLVTLSFSTAIVIGDRNVGGFIGLVYNSNLSYCYSKGSVKGNTFVGGLLGQYHAEKDIRYVTSCYSSASVYANASNRNGFIGKLGLAGVYDNGTINNCYYDIETSKCQYSLAGGTHPDITAYSTNDFYTTTQFSSPWLHNTTDSLRPYLANIKITANNTGILNSIITGYVNDLDINDNINIAETGICYTSLSTPDSWTYQIVTDVNGKIDFDVSTLSSIDYYITIYAKDNNGDYYLGDILLPGDIYLPITLTKFNATYNNNEAVISWTTVCEINNDYFTLERSYDLQNWELVDNIQGAGNSKSELWYQTTDYPEQKTVYYRLSQTDYDGKSETFSPISLKVEKAKSNFIIYPNPTSTISYLKNDYGQINIEIIDINGNILKKLSSVNTKVNLPIINLESGIYIVRIIKENKIIDTTRLIKN